VHEAHERSSPTLRHEVQKPRAIILEPDAQSKRRETVEPRGGTGVGTKAVCKTYRSGMSIESGVALVGRALESMDCAVWELWNSPRVGEEVSHRPCQTDATAPQCRNARTHLGRS
jgi:hypothetical protein